MATTYNPFTQQRDYSQSVQSGNAYSNTYGTGSTTWRPTSGGGYTSTNPYGSGTYNSSYPSYGSNTSYPTYSPSYGGYGIGTSSGTSKGGTPTYSTNPVKPSQFSTMSNPNDIFQPGGPSATVPVPQQPAYDPNDPSIDFINPDGTPHFNPQFGQHDNSGGSNNTPITPGGLPRDAGNQGGISRDGDPDYNPGTNTPTSSVPGAVYSGPNWAMPFNWGNYSGIPEKQKAEYNNYLANYLQFMQGGQNAYQYGNDFAEAQRQYNLDYARGITQDQFQQQFSNDQLEWQKQQGMFDQTQRIITDKYNMMAGDRQFGLDQQQANWGQQNWQQQFGEGQRQYNQNLDFEKQKNQQQYGLAVSDQELRRLAQEQDFQIAQGRLGLDTTQVNNQNRQFYDNLNQQGLQFNQNLDFEKMKNQQQYGLALTDQQLRSEIERGRLSLDTQQVGNQNQQFYANLQQEGQQFDKTYALQQLQEQHDYYVQTGQLQLAQQTQQQQNAIAQGRLSLDTQLGMGQLGLAYQQNQQQYGLNQREQGLNEWQAQQDAQYKYAALQQSAVQEANRLGVSVQELMQSREYQQAQTQIERDRLAQQGSISSMELALRAGEQGWQQQYQQMQLAQQMAIEQMRLQAQKEQASIASTGRLQAPNTRWLRSG